MSDYNDTIEVKVGKCGAASGIYEYNARSLVEYHDLLKNKTHEKYELHEIEEIIKTNFSNSLSVDDLKIIEAARFYRNKTIHGHYRKVDKKLSDNNIPTKAANARSFKNLFTDDMSAEEILDQIDCADEQTKLGTGGFRPEIQKI